PRARKSQHEQTSLRPLSVNRVRLRKIESSPLPIIPVRWIGEGVHMESKITIGQHFTFTVLSANPAQERQAVVTRVLSNREEGMGLEVDYYVAYWVEAHELPEAAAPTALVFERGNDGNVCLDGQVVSITLLK